MERDSKENRKEEIQENGKNINREREGERETREEGGGGDER